MLVCTSILLTGITASAVGATVTPSRGLFVGKTSRNIPIRLTVTPDHKHVKILYCKRTRVTASLRKGRFSVRRTIAGGAVTDLRLRGSWSSRTEVSGFVDLDLTGCKQGGDGTFSATLRG